MSNDFLKIAMMEAVSEANAINPLATVIKTHLKDMKLLIAPFFDYVLVDNKPVTALRIINKTNHISIRINWEIASGVPTMQTNIKSVSYWDSNTTNKSKPSKIILMNEKATLTDILILLGELLSGDMKKVVAGEFDTFKTPITESLLLHNIYEIASNTNNKYELNRKIKWLTEAKVNDIHGHPDIEKVREMISNNTDKGLGTMAFWKTSKALSFLKSELEKHQPENFKAKGNKGQTVYIGKLEDFDRYLADSKSSILNTTVVTAPKKEEPNPNNTQEIEKTIVQAEENTYQKTLKHLTILVKNIAAKRLRAVYIFGRGGVGKCVHPDTLVNVVLN